jgi:hypothetical protein
MSAKPAGRPRKFNTPSRVITLTLPEATLEKLTTIHADRAHAIVQAAEFAVPTGEVDRTGVQIVTVGASVGMLTVPYSPRLREIPGLSLAQILPNRFIIVLAGGTSFADVEVALMDQLDRIEAADAHERSILTDLLEHLRKLRRSERINMAEVILVEMAS